MNRVDGVSLPIFTRSLDELTLFYAPGYLAAADHRQADQIRRGLAGEPTGNRMAAQYLTQAAHSAMAQWAAIHDPDNYQPTCLTLYTSLACNLRCQYCFAAADRRRTLPISVDLIRKTADFIIHENCLPQGKPFTVVFHGGGEPTLDRRIPTIVKILRQMSTYAEVSFHSYIATNGVMDETAAVKIAECFYEIGLSVDGPPDIQNRQRPLKDGGETAEIIERTAAIIREHQKKLTVRATVLPENFSRMEAIAESLFETLHADEIHLEPVYVRGTGINPDLADRFCDHFLSVKRQTGALLSFSGSRIREIHGRYCNVFRQALQLVPELYKGPGLVRSMDDQRTSSCFAVSTWDHAVAEGLETWPLWGNLGMMQKLSRSDSGCADCFNQYHCARGCPDVCPALTPSPQDAGSFRCRVNRTLAEAELLDLARSRLLELADQNGYAGMKLREF